MSNYGVRKLISILLFTLFLKKNYTGGKKKPWVCNVWENVWVKTDVGKSISISVTSLTWKPFQQRKVISSSKFARWSTNSTKTFYHWCVHWKFEHWWTKGPILSVAVHTWQAFEIWIQTMGHLLLSNRLLLPNDCIWRQKYRYWWWRRCFRTWGIGCLKNDFGFGDPKCSQNLFWHLLHWIRIDEAFARHWCLSNRDCSIQQNEQVPYFKWQGIKEKRKRKMWFREWKTLW